MKLADALVHALKLWGVEFIFGVSGANIEHLHDAIHREGGSKLRSIFAKSENGAAFMADGYARRHNRLGVCCATSGGGMINLAVGIAESYADSIPVLAIIGQPPSHLEGRGAFQDSSGKYRSVNATTLFSSMTKFTARIDTPSDFWPKLHEAVSKALNGRQGPSVLLIPRDLFDQDVGSMPSAQTKCLQEFITPSPLSSTEIEALWQALFKAQFPVLLLGTGIARSSKKNAVIEFAKQSGIAVVSTMADPGIYPNDLPNYLGMVGAAGHPSAHTLLNEVADLIVSVGCDLNIMVRSALSFACDHKPFAVVNSDPRPITKILTPVVIVKGDAGVVFESLLARQSRSSLGEIRPFHYDSTRYLAQETNPHLSAEKNSLLQSEALLALEEALRGKGHLIFDAGNCAAAAVHYLKIPKDFHSTIALGFGGMGYAIAAAIGAQLGNQDDHTVVICGDGAFLMLGTEVHTAVEYALPILFVVFNNNSHGMCKTRQKVFFEGRSECSTYHAFNAEVFAQSFGSKEILWTKTAKTKDELALHLSAYFAQKPLLPGVLQLDLQREEMPPFAPFLPKDAKTYATHSGIRFLRHNLDT